MIKNWYIKKIVLNGFYPGIDRQWFSKISMLNHFIAVVILLSLIFSVFFLFSASFISWMLCLFSLLFLFPFVLIKKHKFKIARNIAVFFTNFILVSQTLTLGVETGSYFFYFPVFASLFYLFFTKEKKALLFNYLYSALCLFLLFYFKENTGFMNHQSTYYNDFLFFMNFIGALLATTIAVLLINIKAEKNALKYLYKSKEIKVKNARLEKSIREKNVLLTEVHHRVKNNLAVISGMIDLQAHLSKNSETKSVLQDSSSRIASLSLIHEKIYKHDDLTQVDMVKYIQDLCHELEKSILNVNLQINFSFQLENFHLDIAQAVPCGLIINEIITNAIKHAFVGKEKGELIINSSVNGKNVILSIIDNGSGFDKDMHLKNSSSLGMVIIDSLVKQLEGTYNFSTEEGTKFTMSFNLDHS